MTLCKWPASLNWQSFGTLRRRRGLIKQAAAFALCA